MITYTYQWKRCDANGDNCVDISGATNQAYSTVNDDVGSRLRVLVTAHNFFGSTDKLSSPTAIIKPIINLVQELNTANAIVPVRSVTLGVATETNTANSLAKFILVGRADETDTANSITRITLGILGQATETDTATGFTKYIKIGIATESNKAKAFNDTDDGFTGVLGTLSTRPSKITPGAI